MAWESVGESADSPVNAQEWQQNWWIRYDKNR